MSRARIGSCCRSPEEQKVTVPAGTTRPSPTALCRSTERAPVTASLIYTVLKSSLSYFPIGLPSITRSLGWGRDRNRSLGPEITKARPAKLQSVPGTWRRSNSLPYPVRAWADDTHRPWLSELIALWKAGLGHLSCVASSLNGMTP